MTAQQLFDVSGRIAFVTGAASGLGLAMSEIMAESGARVTMLDIDRAGLEAAAARLKQAGHEVLPVVQDVADTEGLRQAIDATARTCGRLDVVFANAGMSAGPSYAVEAGEIANVSLTAWEQVLKVNLTSVFATMQAAALHMKPQKSGRIIVTSSIAGIHADDMVAYAYAATKAAVNNLVRQAAMELAPYNVLVNAIAPGPFYTNIAGGRLHRDPAVVKAFEARVPLGRIARTEEIKGLALFLASPASSYLTGTVIPIDGGATAA
jgi:NAD(P)-dependent dehydrogenase (short-subunit alcohol dehydrogenase family)